MNNLYILLFALPFTTTDISSRRVCLTSSTKNTGIFHVALTAFILAMRISLERCWLLNQQWRSLCCCDSHFWSRSTKRRYVFPYAPKASLWYAAHPTHTNFMISRLRKHTIPTHNLVTREGQRRGSTSSSDDLPVRPTNGLQTGLQKLQ